MGGDPGGNNPYGFARDTSRALILGYAEAKKDVDGDWILSIQPPPGATGFPWALQGRTFKN